METMKAKVVNIYNKHHHDWVVLLKGDFDRYKGFQLHLKTGMEHSIWKGSSAPREKLRYRRENPVDVGHRHTRLRTGLGFPMTGKRLLRDAQNPGRHRRVP